MQPSKKEIGNLVIDGIPDIPPRIIERTNQYQNVRAAALCDWEPSGKGMLITTRFADAFQIHYVSAPGAYRQQLTFFREPVYSAWYEPRNPQKDHHGFIFSMDAGGGEYYQLYRFDQDTGSYSMLTDGKSKNVSPVWSNSGEKIAFASTKRNGIDFDIYLMAGIDSKTIRLVKEVKGWWNPLDWSFDDSQLLLYHYISVNEVYLYTLNLGTGELLEINATHGLKKIAYGSVAFARQRQGFYYTSDEDSEFLRLTHYNNITKKKELLAPNLNWDVDQLAVSIDGEWFSYATNEGGVSKLYLASTSDPTKAQNINLPKGVISSLKFDRQSRRLGFTMSTAQSPSDVYALEVKTGEVIRWTFSEVGGLNPERFVSPDLIEYPTFDTVDRKPWLIPAFYYKPKAESKPPFPVIINIHGGPEGQAFASFDSTIQYWVNELGAAVLVPNVRGSSGYGKTYLQLDNGYKREDSVKDIGKLLDWIATRPELDAKRVAVFGGSYGGYMVLASMFHYNHRLKCGVDVVGISNFVTFLENTAEYRRDLRRQEYGDERDPKMREFLISISPTTNAHKITKPLFAIQGLNDPRVPMTEAEQIVKTVRDNGRAVWYLLAKDEGHGFQKKANRDFYLNAVSFFFEEHLIK